MRQQASKDMGYAFKSRQLWPRLLFLSMVAGLVLLFQLPLVWSFPADAPIVSTTAKKLVGGLTLSFEDGKGAVDARDARLVMLLVPKGEPPSPFLQAGPFKATWTGVITTRIKDTYKFAAEGKGDLTVSINENVVLDVHGDFSNQPSQPTVVKKGKIRLKVVYKSPAEGDANIRLLWTTEDKPFEPIDPMNFSHDTNEDIFAQHSKVRMGREIFGSMRCMNCHQVTGMTTAGAMPEIKQDAPNLTDIKNRLSPNWIAYWITNPKALRPTASMPRVFHDQPADPQPTVDQRAWDIAAYLCKLPMPPASPPRPAMTDATELGRGARLFTGLGCVACHVAPGIEDSDPTLNRVPLKYVKAKFGFDPQLLIAEFLKKPEAHYAWIKMPNFHLTDDEASELAGWLVSKCKNDELPPIKLAFDAANGKKLFESAGCLSCHAADGLTPKPPTAVDLAHADWTRGCTIGGGAAKAAVDFGFTAEQTDSLRAFASVDWKSSLDRDPPTEFAARQMTALRCNACHSMDTLSSSDNIWSNLDTEISTIEQGLPHRPLYKPENGPVTIDVDPPGEQSRPPLTWTGEKLRPSWIASFIAGQVAYKPRTWVFARMPSFASRADLLAKGMVMTHGCPVTDEVRPPADLKLADIGKTLTNQVYFGCVKCHACGNQAAIAPFEAYAPNLANVSERLRHQYFSRWMWNPQNYLHGTKMPTFTQSDGTTAFVNILDGKAAKQYEAVWQYLQAGEKIVPVQ